MLTLAFGFLRGDVQALPWALVSHSQRCDDQQRWSAIEGYKETIRYHASCGEGAPGKLNETAPQSIPQHWAKSLFGRYISLSSRYIRCVSSVETSANIGEET
jgi:hypothetical protein